MADHWRESGSEPGSLNRIDGVVPTAVDHRVDVLFDAFYGPGGARFAVYHNEDRTHWKLTVTEDASASIELTPNGLRWASAVILDALKETP